MDSSQKRDNYHHGSLKQAIANRAASVLEEKGLEGISLRELAESLGVSKNAPYRHFESKRELLVALAADIISDFAAALEAVLAPLRPLDSLERSLVALRRLLAAYCDFALSRRAAYGLMFSAFGYSLESERCRLNSERAFSCLVEAVAAAQSQGWRAAVPLETQTIALWSGLHGWVLLKSDGLLPTWQEAPSQDSVIDSMILA